LRTSERNRESTKASGWMKKAKRLLGCGGFFFAEGADDGHLDIGGVPRSAHHIESTFTDGFQIEFPLADAGSDNHARDLLFAMVGVDQVGIRAIGQMFVAENHFKRLARKDFLGLCSAGTGGYVGTQGLEDVKQSLTQLQAGRYYQRANVAL
jgi:hypothetical protein